MADAGASRVSTAARPYGGRPAGVREADRRERLLAAARDTFAALGYAATSVDHIVARAGVSRTSFYRYFENREQALLAVFDRGLARQAEAVAAAVALDLAPAERIRAEVAAVARAFAADPAMARVVLIEAVGATPAIEAARVAARRAAASVIEDQLAGYPAWRRRSAAERHIAAVAAMAAIGEPISELVATGRIGEWASIVEPVSSFIARALIPAVPAVPAVPSVPPGQSGQPASGVTAKRSE